MKQTNITQDALQRGACKAHPDDGFILSVFSDCFKLHPADFEYTDDNLEELALFSIRGRCKLQIHDGYMLFPSSPREFPAWLYLDELYEDLSFSYKSTIYAFDNDLNVYVYKRPNWIYLTDLYHLLD